MRRFASSASSAARRHAGGGASRGSFRLVAVAAAAAPPAVASLEAGRSGRTATAPPPQTWYGPDVRFAGELAHELMYALDDDGG